MRITFEVPDDVWFRLQKVLNIRGSRKALYNSLTEQFLVIIENADDPELVIKAMITKKVRFILDD